MRKFIFVYMKKVSQISEKNVNNAVQGLKAIAHPARLKILCYLQSKEATVNEIVTMTAMSQSAVSQHLAKMKAFGVLKDRRDGNRIFYRVTNQGFEELVSALCHIYDSPAQN